MYNELWVPALQEREDKYLLAENNDVNDPCRFRLYATMKERNGHPILANTIFYFGRYKDEKPDLYKVMIKVGGSGKTARFYERIVSSVTGGELN